MAIRGFNIKSKGKEEKVEKEFQKRYLKILASIIAKEEEEGGIEALYEKKYPEKMYQTEDVGKS